MFEVRHCLIKKLLGHKSHSLYIQRGNFIIAVFLLVTCTVYQIWPRIHCIPCRANPFPSMINFIVAVDIIIPLFCSACCSGPVCNSGEVELLESIQQASTVIRFREVASLVSNQNTFLDLACSVMLYNAWEWIIFIIITMKYFRISAITYQCSGVTIIPANDYTWSCWITLLGKKRCWVHFLHSSVNKLEMYIDFKPHSQISQVPPMTFKISKRAVW